MAAAFLPPLLMASPTAMHRAAVSLLAERTPTMLNQLEEISCPRHLLIGGNTHIEADSIASIDVPVHLVANSGHSMFVEQPDETAYAILGIVSKAVLEGTQPAFDAEGPKMTT